MDRFAARLIPVVDRVACDSSSRGSPGEARARRPAIVIGDLAIKASFQLRTGLEGMETTRRRSRQVSTVRIAQSMIAIRYRKPRQVTSAHHM